MHGKPIGGRPRLLDGYTGAITAASSTPSAVSQSRIGISRAESEFFISNFSSVGTGLFHELLPLNISAKVKFYQANTINLATSLMSFYSLHGC